MELNFGISRVVCLEIFLNSSPSFKELLFTPERAWSSQRYGESLLVAQDLP